MTVLGRSSVVLGVFHELPGHTERSPQENAVAVGVGLCSRSHHQRPGNRREAEAQNSFRRREPYTSLTCQVSLPSCAGM